MNDPINQNDYDKTMRLIELMLREGTKLNIDAKILTWGLLQGAVNITTSLGVNEPSGISKFIHGSIDIMLRKIDKGE